MTNRVALGAIGGGNYGLKISKPGVDVLSAADKDLSFSSLWPAHSLIHQTGTMTVTTSPTTVSFTDLGFIPVAAMMREISSGHYGPLVWSIVITPSSQRIGPYFQIKSNELQASWIAGSTTYRYWIFNIPMG